MIVYVAGFHPSVDGDSGSGGFEWFYDRRRALLRTVELLWEQDQPWTNNVVFAAIDVPFEVDPARPRTYEDREGEITAWIDANLHLIELPLQDRTFST